MIRQLCTFMMRYYQWHLQLNQQLLFTLCNLDINLCMSRLLVFLFVLTASVSCTKDDKPLPPVVIPDIINGVVLELNVTPINITTPDKGTVTVSTTNAIYNVQFNAVAQAQSNATLTFESDTILTDASKEFSNFGKDAIAYNPVATNEMTIRFNDGKKVVGLFNLGTSVGGVFGEQLISQWRTAGDPSKPNQKAKDDLRNFMKLYEDLDGAGPGTSPVYLFVEVSKQ